MEHEEFTGGIVEEPKKNIFQKLFSRRSERRPLVAQFNEESHESKLNIIGKHLKDGTRFTLRNAGPLFVALMVFTDTVQNISQDKLPDNGVDGVGFSQMAESLLGFLVTHGVQDYLFLPGAAFVTKKIPVVGTFFNWMSYGDQTSRQSSDDYTQISPDKDGQAFNNSTQHP